MRDKQKTAADGKEEDEHCDLVQLSILVAAGWSERFASAYCDLIYRKNLAPFCSRLHAATKVI